MTTTRLVFLSLAALPALAADPVRYEISFDNAVHHEARVSVTISNLATEPLELRMSRSSPGRYAIHEFGKNVYQLEAVDGRGNSLRVSRPNPYQWDVSGHDGTVTANYTLYADRAGGTYSGIDLTHAHLNMPATFMWARGHDDRPVSVTFHPADPNWKIATQLAPSADPMTFTAPDLQYFLDSPVELSDFSERSWTVKSGDKQHTIRLAVHHDGEESDVDLLAEKSKKIVAAQIDVFGEPPDFDFGTYTIIADYLPHVSGDGMEHRNSTIVASTRSLYEAEFAQLGTISHEFFHAWNVERIRPASLEPFDFERANMSPHLWFAEGFTSYYTELAMIRAGELNIDDFADELSDVLNAVILAPGRAFFSAEEMSMLAAFRDAAHSIDRDNFRNTFVSYYTWGDAIGLALDLTLRSRFEGVSLDDFMRHMWREYGKPEDPYDTNNLVEALATVTRDEEFATRFFADFISGQDVADYEHLLRFAGLQLQAADDEAATLGAAWLDFEGKEAIIASNTVIGTPLYEAGLDNGDTILRVGRFRIRDQGDWDKVKRRHEPGESVTIRFIQRGIEREAPITFAADPKLEVVTFESLDREPDQRQLDFRESWLGNVLAD